MQKALKTLLAGILIFGFTLSIASADGQLMTTDQLKSNLGSSDIVILDARGSWDWAKTDDKITGAKRVDPGSVSVWAQELDKGKTIVVYCA